MSQHARNNPEAYAAAETAKRLNSAPTFSDIDQEEQARQHCEPDVFPAVIWADDDLVCGEEPNEYGRGKYVRADVMKDALNQAAGLIAFFGTTGAERTDVLRRAQDWLKVNGYSHLL